MPEINANIVVETVGLTIDQQDPGINIQPEVINMTLYTAGYANPGGNVGTLQYNAGGYFDGVPYANYSNSNLTLGNVNQVKLLGGSNAYFLQTDGTGNLTWASGTVSSNGNGTSNGANTQIQMSDGTGNFVGAAGFTFDYIANSLAVPGEGIFTGNILSGNANLGNAASANFFLGNGSLLTGIDTNIISNGSSNVKIPTLNGNVTISVDGVTNVVVVANNAVNMAANLNVTGNITAGNVAATQLISNIATGTAPLVVTSTTQVANLNAATAGTANSATTAGTVTTAAQPNITSVGTLTNLAVTGNTTSGNFIGVFANGNSNVNIPASNGNVNISSAGNANIAVVTGTGVNVAGTLNVTGNTLLQSLRTKDQAIAIGNNAQGVGLTGAFAIAIGLSAGETNQGTQAIAIGESAGDLNQSANSIAIGTYAGLTNQGANSIAIGAGAGNFNQHSNSIILNATGANFTSDGTDRFYVNPVRQANTSNLLFYNQSTGEISYDAAPSGTIIQNGTSNVSIPAANGNVTVSVAGNGNIFVVAPTGANVNGYFTVTGNSNITGTLGVTGNANTGNLGTARVLASANITAPQLISNVANGTAPLVVTSTTQVANLNSATAGTVRTAAQPNITSVGTLTGLTVSGNISAGNANLGNATSSNFFIGDGSLLTGIGNTPGNRIVDGTSNVIVAPNANVSIGINGTANVLQLSNNTLTLSGVLLANLGNLVRANYLQGTLTTAAQPNITSVGTLTSLAVTGNVTAGNISATTFTGSLTGTATNATTAGTVTTAAQPNITSVGTLVNLKLSSNNIALGNLAANVPQANFAIAIGYSSGANNQPANSIAIGYEAMANGANGFPFQANSIAIGYRAGGNIQLANSIAIGRLAGAQDQDSDAIAIGSLAGNLDQSSFSIAIGAGAGANTLNASSIAIGRDAASNSSGISTIAIGEFAGSNTQGNSSIALGRYAGYTGLGISSIAIGRGAGAPNAQANNSIVINATGANLDGATANALFIKPIRNARNDQTLVYNATTGEISYTNYIKTISTTVGALVAAATVGAGTRAFVTDANTTTFNATVGGSGANSVPVFSDGTNWKVG